MPWDDAINSDIAPVSPDNAALGPRLGFLDSLEASWNAQRINNTRDGLAWEFSAQDEKQAARAKKAGVEYTPLYARQRKDDGLIDGGYTAPQTTVGWGAYRDVAKSIADGTPNAESPYAAEQDEQIRKANEANPSLKLQTLNEMFDATKARAKEIEARDKLSSTTMGKIGSFLGGAAASFDPTVNPLNVATLAVGGVGKTAVMRILSQAGGQGVIESLNQVTGVQESRRLLGLDYGLGNAVESIAGAAIGGAALQGVGEAATAGLRRFRTGRWFADADAPPPPVTPKDAPQTAAEAVARTGPVRDPFQGVDMDLSRSRSGRPRAEADLEHVTAAMNDWGAPPAWKLLPNTETRIPRDALGDPVSMDYRNPDLPRGIEDVNSIARRIDPEAFNVFDKLTAKKAELREQIGDDATLQASYEKASAASEVKAQIDTLKEQMQGASKKNARKLQDRLDALQTDYDARFSGVDPNALPVDQAKNKLRMDLQEVDYQMRDLAPAVTRAYDRAQTKWTAYGQQKEQIDAMLRDGLKELPPPKSLLPEKMPEDAMTTPPSPRELAKVADVQPGETLAAAATRAHDANVKVVDEAIDTFRADATRFAKVEEGKPADTTITLKINGRDVTVPLDSGGIHVPGDKDGETRILTPRQLLQEIEHDNNMLKAITTCSLNATSAPALTAS